MKLQLLIAYTLSLITVSSCTDKKQATTAEKKSSTKAESTETWHDLLAGNNLSQWRSEKKGDIKNAAAWTVKDGVLHLSKAPGLKAKGGSIVTIKDYINFEFKFEFKISKGGNSGVKYRSLKQLGFEYQVLDDKAAKDNKNPLNSVASLYQLVAAPDTKKLKPVGEWNTGRIIANGNQLAHWLNGEKVVEMKLGSEHWKEAFAKSKYKKEPNFGKQGGEILLQDHNDEVSFRNLLIKELK